MPDVADPSRTELSGSSALLAGDAVFMDASGKPTLAGGRCRSCGAVMFPKRAVCTTCMSEDIVVEAMPRTGTLYSFTVLHVGPERWLKPSALGYVDLSNGVRVFSRIAADLRSLRIGQTVELSVAVIGREKNNAPISNFVFTAAE
jgi:uncharacterized OB-fold protein